MATPLEYLRDVKAEGCTRCRLHQNRTRLVFGFGPEDADLMVIGEAPGQTEDEKGMPFVGKSGALLDNLLERAGMPREKVYLANLVKCRPPDNRDPEPDEIVQCSVYLHLQIRLVQPKVILALGRLAGQLLTDELGTPLKTLRNRVWEYESKVTGHKCPVVVTYHPAWLLRRLREPGAKVDAQRVLGDIEEAVRRAQR